MIKKEISKQTFTGNWPFSFDNCTLCRKDRSVFIEVKSQSIALNGIAKMLLGFRSLRFEDLNLTNNSVTDIIKAGNELKDE